LQLMSTDTAGLPAVRQRNRSICASEGGLWLGVPGCGETLDGRSTPGAIDRRPAAREASLSCCVVAEPARLAAGISKPTTTPLAKSAQVIRRRVVLTLPPLLVAS
jgi:hypothetical protein